MKLISNSQWEELQLAMAEMPRLKKLQESEIKLKNEQEQLDHREKLMKETFELNEKKVVAALDDKLTKEIHSLKMIHAEEINKLKADHQRQLVDIEMREAKKTTGKLEKMMEENYSKLKESMAKLHEEGNAQTKFVQDLSKDLVRSLGGSIPLNSHKLQIEETRITK